MAILRNILRPVVRPLMNPLLNRFRAGGVTANGAGQSFNGTDQYAYIADNGALDINQASTDFCLSATIKTNTDITSLQSVFGKNMFVVLSGRYGFYISAGVLKAVIATSVGSFIINDNITLAVNTEYDVLMRVDITNSKLYFYIDGVLQNTGGTDFTGTIGTLDNKFEFYVGAGNSTTGLSAENYFKGLFKDVRIYHKDVTDSASLVKLQSHEKIGGEVAWWDLPTLTGFEGTTYDLTGVNL